MVFASHIFLGFLCLVVLLFAVGSRLAPTHGGKYVLIAASLFFYGYWLPVYLVLLLGSIVFNYSIGGVLLHMRNGGARLWITIGGLAANLALIGYYKYAAFAVENANAFFQRSFDVPDIVLPIGISFFTFQQISYLMEIYRRKVADRDFSNYVLFISFFPQLIAGPIVTQQEMLPQLLSKKAWRLVPLNVALGFALFAVGLFKKTFIIDPYVPYIDIIYDRAAAGLDIGFIDGWTAALGYSFQIYFDFSAYSDMAIGLALIFGLRLPINFFSPYKATSIREFWRRWHITLSRFLRDYIYIPLGGSHHGLPRTVLALLATMGLGGLWHGAGWNFVIWGLAHGALLALTHIADKHGLIPQMPKAKIAAMVYKALAIVVTFVVVTTIWVLFRAVDLASAIAIYNGMFGLSEAKSITDTGRGIFPLFPVYLAIVWFTPNLIQIFRHYDIALHMKEYVSDKTRLWPAFLWTYEIGNWRWATLSALTFVVAYFSVSNLSPFIYFQF